MKRIFLLISVLFCAHFAVAQSNIVNEIESGGIFGPKVKINQPAKLMDLMGSMMTVDGKAPQVEGYRVMVYSGNNSRQARDEANNMAQFMRDKFPGAEVTRGGIKPILNFEGCMSGWQSRKQNTMPFEMETAKAQ